MVLYHLPKNSKKNSGECSYSVFGKQILWKSLLFYILTLVPYPRAIFKKCYQKLVKYVKTKTTIQAEKLKNKSCRWGWDGWQWVLLWGDGCDVWYHDSCGEGGGDGDGNG